MKKVFFIVAAVVLLAAACNSQTSVNSSTPPASNPTGAAMPPASQPSADENSAQVQVDATVDDLNASVNSETITNTQSDSDLLQQDQSVVNDSNGVGNANY